MYEHEIKGSYLCIWFCNGAEESREAAYAKLPNNFHQTTSATLKARLNVLMDRGKLRAPEHMNAEADLPDGTKFYAIKTYNGLRAYGWFSKRFKRIFCISHFVYKTRQKLRPEDTRRVTENWRKMEGK